MNICEIWVVYIAEYVDVCSTYSPVVSAAQHHIPDDIFSGKFTCAGSVRRVFCLLFPIRGHSYTSNSTSYELIPVEHCACIWTFGARSFLFFPYNLQNFRVVIASIVLDAEDKTQYFWDQICVKLRWKINNLITMGRLNV